MTHTDREAGAAADGSVAPGFEIVVVRQSGDWTRCEPVEDGCAAVAWAAMQFADLSVPLGSELVVAFGSDAEVAQLNAQFRDKPQPTNVLSFPAVPQPTDHQIADAGPQALGDVILAAETVMREADAKGVAPRDHMQHLVLHGLLHCLGFDHQDDASAQRMEGLETAILASLEIANPYLEDSDFPGGDAKPLKPPTAL